jgi:hypothetical protein
LIISLNIFVANAFISPFNTQNNAFYVILYTTALPCLPKNLIPPRDSNPGSSVLEADAMTTVPRRQEKENDLKIRRKKASKF